MKWGEEFKPEIDDAEISEILGRDASRAIDDAIAELNIGDIVKMAVSASMRRMRFDIMDNDETDDITLQAWLPDAEGDEGNPVIDFGSLTNLFSTAYFGGSKPSINAERWARAFRKLASECERRATALEAIED